MNCKARKSQTPSSTIDCKYVGGPGRGKVAYDAGVQLFK